MVLERKNYSEWGLRRAFVRERVFFSAGTRRVWKGRWWWGCWWGAKRSPSWKYCLEYFLKPPMNYFRFLALLTRPCSRVRWPDAFCWMDYSAGVQLGYHIPLFRVLHSSSTEESPSQTVYFTLRGTISPNFRLEPKSLPCVIFSRHGISRGDGIIDEAENRI